VELVFPFETWPVTAKWQPTVGQNRLETTKLRNRRTRKPTPRARCKQEQRPTISSSHAERRLHAAFDTTAEPNEWTAGRGHLRF